MSEPILYDIVDTLSKEVTSVSPEFLQDRPILANILYGFIGAYTITKFGGAGISTLFEDSPKALKIYAKAEKIIGEIIPWAALAYIVVDPGAKELMQAHPVYTAGMASAIVGANQGLISDSKRITKNLEELATNSERA